MSFNGNEEQGHEYGPDITTENLFVLSIISAAVYLLLTYVIFYLFDGSSVERAFGHGWTMGRQLLIGVISGGIAAGIIGRIMKYQPVSEVLHDFYIVKMISKMKLTSFDRLQASLFAGVGEELLFRGAIQPLLGIWITSVIFVGLHGYFNFKSLGHLIFGGMMFGLSVLLGYLFEHAGLVAAMSAHAVYDIIMLYLVQKK